MAVFPDIGLALGGGGGEATVAVAADSVADMALAVVVGTPLLEVGGVPSVGVQLLADFARGSAAEALARRRAVPVDFWSSFI